jgi:hypothetical protein
MEYYVRDKQGSDILTTELREHFDANTAAPNNSRLGNVGGLIFRKVARQPSTFYKSFNVLIIVRYTYLSM